VVVKSSIVDWNIQLARGVAWSLKRALQEEQDVVGFISAELAWKTSTVTTEVEITGAIQTTLMQIHQVTWKTHSFPHPVLLWVKP